jgi:hypothetical protein
MDCLSRNPAKARDWNYEEKWKEIYMILDGGMFPASCIILEQLLHIPTCHDCITDVVDTAQERGEYRSRNEAMLHWHIDDEQF